MVLIIAEKPSLARNIADGIRHSCGASPKRHDGYIEAGNYLISWAFGHLFSLSDIEKYAPDPEGGTRWTMRNLPCFPEAFSFELRKSWGEHSLFHSGIKGCWASPTNQIKSLGKTTWGQDTGLATYTI